MAKTQVSDRKSGQLPDLICCVVGHSFVSGLKHHLQNMYSDPITPRQLAWELKVSQLVQSVHLLGSNGKLICDSDSPISRGTLHEIQPDLCILDIGSNDLAQGKQPLEVAVKVVELARTFVTDFKVKHVFVCGALNRDDVRLPNFKGIVTLYNKFLIDLCEVEPDVAYWVHKGFWSVPVSSWSRDGTHPNTELGRKKYKTSLKCAVFRSLQALRPTYTA